MVGRHGGRGLIEINVLVCVADADREMALDPLFAIWTSSGTLTTTLAPTLSSDEILSSVDERRLSASFRQRPTEAAVATSERSLDLGSGDCPH
jgi:hypothetical protein